MNEQLPYLDAESVPFDFERVEQALGEAIPEEDASIHDRQLAELFRQVMEWCWYPGRDLEGITCRCVLLCWFFVPSLREYTMTDMARRFGKRKQSLGRHVEEFKKKFPQVHIMHFKK